MRETRMSVPLIALISATRGMLGFGIGVLASKAIARRQRKAVGWTLVAIGALSTIPLAYLAWRPAARVTNGRSQVAREEVRTGVIP